jgi:CHAT domain-containing protein/tetratricopeptide (TPR) repeat protein
MLCCLYTSHIHGQSVGNYAQIELAYESGEYQKCIVLINEHKKELTTAKDAKAAEVFFYLGDSYLVEGDVQQAVENFEKELELREILADNEELSGTLYNLMYLYNDLGQYKEAKTTGMRLLSVDKATFGLKSEEYIMSVASYLDVLGNQSDFAALIKQGEKTLKSINEVEPEYGMLLNKVADGYSALGDYSKAEKLFEGSLEAVTKSKGANSVSYAAALSNVGLMYRDQGRYTEAEAVFTTCIAILEERGSTEAIEQSMSVLNNLAVVYLELSNYEATLDAFSKIEQYDAEMYGTEHPYYAMTLNNIGEAYNEKGSYEEALNYYDQVTPIIEKSNGKNSVLYADNLNNKGRAKMLSGKLEESVALLEEALEVYKTSSGKSSSLFATSVFNLGRAYQKMGDPKAKKYFEEALKIRKKNLGTNHPLYGKILPYLAANSWSSGDIKESLGYFRQTFDNYFTQIDAYFSALSESEKTKFYYGGLRIDFEKFNAFATANHDKMPELTGQMYNYQLNTKALIMYATDKVRANISTSGDQELINEYAHWLSLKEQLSKLYSVTAAADLSKIDSLNILTNTLEKSLSKRSAQFDETHGAHKHNWQQVRDQLKPGEAAVEVVRFRDFNPTNGGTFTGDIKYAVLIVKPTTKDYPELVMLENGKLIEERYIINYRNSIRFQIFDIHSYGVLWKPIAPALKGVDKIYFSPDGVYNQISINSIYNPDTKQYLLEEMNIHNVTNTKDILSFGKTSNKKKGQSMLFGFPDYNFENKSPTTQGETRSLRSLRGGSTGVTRGLRAGLLRYLRGDEGIAMLPGTKTEVDNIAKMFLAEEADHSTFYNQEAEEAILKEAKSPELLHIATHGFFMANVAAAPETDQNKYIENPLLRSGLVLAGAGSFLKSGSTYNDQDGILTAYEAMNMDLNDTEVVVMSACETGLGTITNGEGVYGLQRAFLVAGAKSLIMSMWSVDDDATQELMTAFYKEWLISGNKQESFRRAQYVVKEKYPEPFYWGAFIMVGE